MWRDAMLTGRSGFSFGFDYGRQNVGACLERIGDGQGEIVGVDVSSVGDGHFAHEVHQFGGHDQREVHRHDDDQRQRDAIGRADVTSAARPPTAHPTSGRLDAHAQRAAQLGDEVDVAEDETHERRQDADHEVGPVVGALDVRVLGQPADVREVEVATLAARNGADPLSSSSALTSPISSRLLQTYCRYSIRFTAVADDRSTEPSDPIRGNGADPVAEEARHVGEDADGEDDGERERGEGPADDLAGVQRVANGDVAADGHRDRQPRAGHDERVDERVAVRRVDDAHVVATEAERRGANVGARKHRDTEQRVRHRQPCTTDSRHLATWEYLSQIQLYSIFSELPVLSNNHNSLRESCKFYIFSHKWKDKVGWVIEILFMQLFCKVILDCWRLTITWCIKCCIDACSLLSLPSFTGNRNNIEIFLYNWCTLYLQSRVRESRRG